MIIIKYLFYYGKALGIFTLFEIFLSFVTALINMIGITNSVTNLFLFILNILTVSFIGYKFGKKTTKKAIIEGIILSIMFSFILAILNLMFIRFLTVKTIIYYMILSFFVIISTLISKNKKTTLDKK